MSVRYRFYSSPGSGPEGVTGLFVTGTDTGIGKTVVTAALAVAARRNRIDVGVMKPVATGCRRESFGLVSEDAEFLAGAADCLDPLSQINPCRYFEPISPHLAARREGRPVDLNAIASAYAALSARHRLMFVEGAGGLLTPISDTQFIADIAGLLGLPLIIVTNAGLGTLNRTGLTIEAARTRKLEIAGVIINRYDAESATLAEETAAAEIERVFRVPVLASLPTDPSVNPSEAVAGHDLVAILSRIIQWNPN